MLFALDSHFALSGFDGMQTTGMDPDTGGVQIGYIRALPALAMQLHTADTAAPLSHCQLSPPYSKDLKPGSCSLPNSTLVPHPAVGEA